MTLKEQALSADKAQRSATSEAAAKRREESLDKVLTYWSDKYGGWGQFDPIPEAPAREAFALVRDVPTDSHRRETVSGWKVEIDGVSFLRVTDYGAESWRVFLTCPHCGAEFVADFHGPAGLGERLRTQQGILRHKCRQAEARSLAYAIGAAARDANTTAEDIIDLALTQHSDTLYRAMGR